MRERLEPALEKNEGYNVDVTVYLMRHAHKGSLSGPVSSKGEETAEKLKTAFNRYQSWYETDDLDVGHSGHKRPRKTAQILSGNQEQDENVRRNLAFHSSSNFSRKYTELARQNGGDESAGVQMVIDTADKRFDPKSLSSVEISQGVAQEFLDIVDQTKTYKSGTKKPIALISHTGLIENFLVDLLGKRSERNSLEAIGGNLDFLEDFRLYINRRSPSEVSLKYRFRNFQGELSEERLRQLAGQQK